MKKVSFGTGIITPTTPIVTGLSNPGGMMFVSTARSEESPKHSWDAEACKE